MSSMTTKKAMATSLKELLLEKPLPKITVNDITERCDINRQTFYYHFQDIQDLVEWICLMDAEKVLKGNKTYDTWQEGFLSIFYVLMEDKPFVTNIYRSVSLETLNRYLYRVVYPLLYNVVEEKAKDFVVREEDKKFIADFFKYAFVAIVLEWIGNDMKEEPEGIIERLNLMIEGSIEHALQNYSRSSGSDILGKMS